jgi:hypothetical protein
MSELRENKICECDCHKDGNHIMHMMECCELCHTKYISKSGVVDIESWSIAFKKIYMYKPIISETNQGTFVWLSS